jgi:hypothetical protein
MVPYLLPRPLAPGPNAWPGYRPAWTASISKPRWLYCEPKTRVDVIMDETAIQEPL